MTNRIPHPNAVAPEVLAQIGEGHVAYVREMKSDDFARLFPGGPELPAGIDLFALFGATGRPLLVADARELALAGARDQDLVPVSLQ